MGMWARAMVPKCNMGPELDLGTKEGPFVETETSMWPLSQLTVLHQCECPSFETCIPTCEMQFAWPRYVQLLSGQRSLWMNLG